MNFARPNPSDPEAEYYSRLLASKSVIDFATYTLPTYIPGLFHTGVGSVLMDAVEEGNKRIMIFAPPQHGKSELVSVRFPPYWLAKKPTKPVIICSYGATLAQSKASQAKEVIMSAAYERVFPELYKGMDPKEKATYRKRMYRMITSAGVGGSITGFGAGLGIIDDPVKNFEQAESGGYRDKAWKWYQTTFRTRIWENGVILLIMTRWHEDDLAGRLLNDQGSKWTIYRYPALAETQERRDFIAQKLGQPIGAPDPLGRRAGEPVAANRFSKNTLLEIQDEVGPLAWEAEYQGFPQPPGGTMFKEDWFKIVDTIPNVIKRVRYWDKAGTSGGGARTCGLLMSSTGRDFFIEDVVKGQWSTWQREEVIRTVTEEDESRYGTVDTWLEEEGGSGGIDSRNITITSLAGYAPHFERATKAKEIRAAPLAVQAEAGHVYMLRGPWNREFIHEITTFPNGVFKDQVDCASGALRKLIRRGWARGASS
jgi:predicted phage terminase large subunit-like protein